MWQRNAGVFVHRCRKLRQRESLARLGFGAGVVGAVGLPEERHLIVDAKVSLNAYDACASV